MSSPTNPFTIVMRNASLTASTSQTHADLFLLFSVAADLWEYGPKDSYDAHYPARECARILSAYGPTAFANQRVKKFVAGLGEGR